MRYAFAILLSAFLLCTSAFAQPSTSTYTLQPALNYGALQPGQQAVVAIAIDLKKGYHAQSHTPTEDFYIPLEIKLDPTPGVKAFAPQYPKGVDHDYAAIGKLNVYEGKVVIFVPLEIAADVKAGDLKLSGVVSLQVCDDQTCFAPEEAKFEVATTIVPAGQTVEAANGELFATFDPAAWSSNVESAGGGVVQEKPATRGAAVTFAAYLGSALFAGVLFNLVPCVLPVLPLKILGIYEVSRHNRAKCFSLGVAFSVGIIATFAALAIPVFVFRQLQWGELFSRWWFTGPLVLILLGMALQMFGVFEVVLPKGLYKIDASHDTYSGNFLFGILTAILSTPCTFGLFGGVIAFALTQSGAFAVALMCTTGLGMALPYLVLSAFPEWAAKFPRTGPWSNLIKQTMGFLLIAVALYFGQPFLPAHLRDGQIWWAIFVVACAAAAFVMVRSLSISSTLRVAMVAGAISLLLVAPTLAVTIKLTQHKVKWTPFSDAALAEARTTNQPVIVKFTATWCANCHTVEARVFGNQNTVDALGKVNVKYVKADLTDTGAAGWPLLRGLNPAGGIPLTAVYLPGEDKPRVLQGIYSSADLLSVVAKR